MLTPPLANQRASSKIETSEHKTFCVLQFATKKCAITVQRAFRIKFDCHPPNDKNILRWHHQFETTGCLCKGKKHVETWMACDAEDCGFQMLNDDEIVTSVQEEADHVGDEADEDGDNNNNESSKSPSNADVFSALETAMEW
ncbi:DUF4817 domain-containing protein [Trichonephila clavipes]|nr:DUF4817 domain-containing protein [Trichonephila clavipes]